ncbi:hypothetical protein V3C99_017910 [Haemonchus contortus]
MEEDSEMVQSLADELESANQEFTEDADVNPTAELLRVKAIERQRITERRKLLLTGQEPRENEFNEQRSNAGNNTEGIPRTPLTATSEAMDYSSSGQRAIKKGEKFEDFLRQFNLKYPETTWRDNERRDILVGLLEGEARMHYNTLSKEIQNGSLQTLVEALKVRLKVDGPEKQARAMRKLRSLKKKSNQSDLEFCLELEVLSVKAHPKADETALAFIRAEILQEQLSQWPETIQLLEILGTRQQGL